jgi:CheY-like chemotaxis protein/HPt (histidine-containing phosphotransfer) domain-containing protein
LIDLPVLIVDDNATNCSILKEILSKWGMRPTAVSSGTEALSIIGNRITTGQPFALMILDVNMPGMDGFEVAERVSKNPALRGATIMMLSSATRPGDLARCKEAGVAAYLMKPVRRGELLETVLEVLGSQVAKAGHVRTSKTRSANERRRGIRILLVEDNSVNQMVALRLLEKHKHRVLVAGNGREALLALEKTAFQGFDLVLMDLQMPEMDGLQATAAIREKEKGTGRRVPIVAMTAHAMKGDKERCLAAGMDAYLSKPIRTQALFEVIEELAGVRVETTENSLSPSKPDEQALDQRSILSLFEGDTELIREVVGLFLEDCPRQMSAIRAAVEHSDAEAINRTAHSFKGSLSNFAAPGAFQAAQNLEGLGRDGDLSHAKNALRALEEQVYLLQSAMGDLDLAEGCVA